MSSFILARIRQRRGAERLWVCLIGSTLLDEVSDTILFCTVAFVGIIPGHDFFNCVLTGYVCKVGMEVVLLPITYRAVALVRKHEGLKPEEVLAAQASTGSPLPQVPYPLRARTFRFAAAALTQALV